MSRAAWEEPEPRVARVLEAPLTVVSDIAVAALVDRTGLPEAEVVNRALQLYAELECDGDSAVFVRRGGELVEVSWR